MAKNARDGETEMPNTVDTSVGADGEDKDDCVMVDGIKRACFLFLFLLCVLGHVAMPVLRPWLD